MLSWLSGDGQRCSFPPGGCWPGRANLHLSYPSLPQPAPLAVPALDLADVPLQPPALFPFHSLPATAGRQHSFLNASQASSRWCLSLKANKCFGALIYLRKHHLNDQGQEAPLKTPFLVDFHSLITSSKHTEFTLYRVYITNG